MLQCLALSGVCFLEIGIGAQAMIPTIVIGPLQGNGTSTDETEFLTITSEEATWFGKYLPVDRLHIIVNVYSILST